MLGKTIGRYRIEKEIGRGGMARVYLAQDPNFNRAVAIKVLASQFSAHDTIRTRFLREAKTIAALEHAAIVPVYDFGEDENQPYLVMRHMSGGSLADKQVEESLSLAQAVSIALRMCAALDAAHARGVVHRDIKPGNILFDSQGEAYLSDFGIAKISDASAQLTGKAFIGTPAYFSPEQAERGKEINGRTDIYALGVVFFEMLSGEKPFDADTPLGIVLQHVNEPVPAIHEIKDGLPGGVQQILEKAMHKQPEKRYQTPGQMAASLRSLLDPAAGLNQNAAAADPQKEYPETIVEEALAVAIPPPLQARHEPPRRFSNGCLIATIFGMAALAILVVGSAGIFAFGNRRPPTSQPTIDDAPPTLDATASAQYATQEAAERAAQSTENSQATISPEDLARQIVTEAQANATAMELARAVITLQNNDLIDFFETGYRQADFVLAATFFNPYDPSVGSWDYGIGFRSQNLDEQLQLVIESDGTWYTNFRQGENLLVIHLEALGSRLNVEAGERNEVILVARGERGFFLLNDLFIAELDLSRLTQGGELFFGSGFYGRNELAGQSTIISDIKIWDLP